MKNLITFLLLLLLAMQAQSQNFLLSNQSVTTLDGKSMLLDDMLKSSEGTIVVFWEPSNKDCISNLENLQEAWVNEVRDLGVDLIAICIDKSGNWPKIKPLIAGKGWEFDVYVDVNGAFARRMNINSAPYTVLFDAQKKIQCMYAGYCSGDENQICNKIINCIESHGTLAAMNTR